MRFDQDSVDDRLSRLAPPGHVVFAALCAELLLPAYEAYSDPGRGDDVELVRASLGSVWNWLSSPSLPLESTSRLEAQLPGEDDEWVEGTEFVESAIACVMYAMKASASADSKPASWAAAALYEAADSAGQLTVPVRGTPSAQLEQAVESTPAAASIMRVAEGFLRALEAGGVAPVELRSAAREAGESWRRRYLPPRGDHFPVRSGL